MKKVSLFIALLATMTMHAQIDTLTYNRYIKEMKLPTLQNGRDSLAFRVIFMERLVTINTADYKSYSGTVTFFLSKLNPKDKLGNKSKIKFETFKMHPDTAKIIGELFLKDSIYALPSAESLNWVYGTDGYNYTFESFYQNVFKSKTYWCPGCGYTKNKYADKIYRFGKYVFDLTEATKLNIQFRQNLPVGEYTDGWSIYPKKHK